MKAALSLLLSDETETVITVNSSNIRIERGSAHLTRKEYEQLIIEYCKQIVNEQASDWIIGSIYLIEYLIEVGCEIKLLPLPNEAIDKVATEIDAHSDTMSFEDAKRLLEQHRVYAEQHEQLENCSDLAAYLCEGTRAIKGVIDDAECTTYEVYWSNALRRMGVTISEVDNDQQEESMRNREEERESPGAMEQSNADGAEDHHAQDEEGAA